MIDPKLKKQMEWIEGLPSTREAERLMKLAKVDRVEDTPALLDLLRWAVLEAAAEMHLEVDRAAIMSEELDYLATMKPALAVRILLQVDDPEEETGSYMAEAHTPRQAALAVIALANQAVYRP